MELIVRCNRRMKFTFHWMTEVLEGMVFSMAASSAAHWVAISLSTGSVRTPNFCFRHGLVNDHKDDELIPGKWSTGLGH